MEISPHDLKEKLDKGNDVVILDIREPHELHIASLDNTLHIPQGELAGRISELEQYREQEIIVYCRTGKRSLLCTNYLQSQGFKQVFNLTGGIHAWSDDIDPTVMKY